MHISLVLLQFTLRGFSHTWAIAAIRSLPLIACAECIDFFPLWAAVIMRCGDRVCGAGEARVASATMTARGNHGSIPCPRQPARRQHRRGRGGRPCRANLCWSALWRLVRLRSRCIVIILVIEFAMCLGGQQTRTGIHPSYGIGRNEPTAQVAGSPVWR